MPLRDHFRPPLDNRRSWDEVHGQWPAMIVQQLSALLPEGYEAAPRIHVGSSSEIDIATFETDESNLFHPPIPGVGGSNTALETPPKPSLIIETDLPAQDEYEVRVYDVKRGRRLVAAVELVGPANKDRPEHRAVFVAKCLSLLQQQVSVSIVDVVTIRDFNLYSELLNAIGHHDSSFEDPSPTLYAVTCRTQSPRRKENLLNAWTFALTIGQPLPRLPLLLTDELMISLDLEASCEDTCRVLRIP